MYLFSYFHALDIVQVYLRVNPAGSAIFKCIQEIFCECWYCLPYANLAVSLLSVKKERELLKIGTFFKAICINLCIKIAYL